MLSGVQHPLLIPHIDQQINLRVVANGRSIDERTIVHFADNPHKVIQAYVDSGEGLDRAGGFAAQGMGGILLRKYDGDYWNVVGFPAASFFKFLAVLIKEEEDFLSID